MPSVRHMTNDDQLLDRYQREYVNYHQISDERWRQQRKLLLEFAATIGGDLSAARYQHLQAFAGDLVAKGLHVNTVRKKLNQIRPFYSWCYAAGIIPPDQYLELRNVKDPRGATASSEPRPYSRTQVRAFWAELDAKWRKLPSSGRGSRAIIRWRQGKGPWGRVWRHAMRLQMEAMVRLALDCGLRRMEIFRLTVADMHYDNEYLVVWRAAKGRKGVRMKQLVPFTKETRAAIYTWLEFRALMGCQHESPWVSCYGPAFNKPMWLTRFSVLLQSVGEDWEWHRFRHTCATEWLRAGMPLQDVSRLLGHASIQQTLAYAKIVEKDILRSVEEHEAAFEKAVGRAA